MSRASQQIGVQIWGALALLLAAILPVWAQGDDFGAGGRKVDIYLTIEPKNRPEGSVQMTGQESVTAPGEPVRISGVTSRGFAGQQLAVTIDPPAYKEKIFAPEHQPGEDECKSEGPTATSLEAVGRQKPKTLMADVDVNGRFEVEFTPKVEGKHTVKAVDAGRAHRGEAEFEVVNVEIKLLCIEISPDEIAETSAELYKNVCDITDALVNKVATLPDSPAKEEFEKQLKKFQANRANVLACGEAPSWAWGPWWIKDLPKVHPRLKTATAPVERKIRDWQRDADQAAEQGSKVLSKITSGNVLCDDLDLLVNGLKYIDFVLGLLVEPAKFLEEWAIENVPTKLVSLIPPIGRTPAVKEGVELGWKGVVSYKPTRKGGKIKIGVKGGDALMAHAKMGNAILTYASSRIFDAYCQTFQGPMSGRMEADFRSPNGDIWWRYTIEISGKLILRYPKSASGKVIRMTGEFMGNATKFDSWDNAVPVLFPEMAMGTVWRTMRIEPLAANAVFQKNFGGEQDNAVPDMNPISSTIEQGGNITQFVMTPAYFNVPVKAELEGKTMRLELRKAQEDFDDLRVKVVQIMLPVLSLWPDVIDYALPYKGAQFMMFRAMNDGPVSFKVEQDKEKMWFTDTFRRMKRGAEATGVYSVKIRACNPGC